MQDLGIGRIIKHPQQKDAIHIAVAPVEAVYEMKPGQLVRMQNGKPIYTLNIQHAIGIVDPFLQQKVQPGEKFWLFLFPGSITSLRHDWGHPSFPVEQQSETQAQAKEWLTRFAQENSTNLSDVLRAAEEGWTSNGKGIEVPEEFWIFYKMYTGLEGSKTDYFSCSC